MTGPMLDCVILAGAPADDDLKARYNVNWRAEAPVAGRRMADRVLDALRDSGCIRNRVLVGAFQSEAEVTVPPGGTFLENLMRGIEAAGEDAEMVLVASSDIPMASGPAIRRLVEEGLSLEADFVYPVIRKEDCERSYPGLRRTYLRLREGTFTGGNAVLINRRFALQNRDRIEGIYQARKQPFRLAAMIGVSTLIRALVAQKLWAGALDIPTVERAAERAIGGKLRALVCPDPEIGEDLDRLEDILVVERLLAGRAAQGELSS